MSYSLFMYFDDEDMICPMCGKTREVISRSDAEVKYFCSACEEIEVVFNLS